MATTLPEARNSFVGREPELRCLRGALEATSSGHGRLLLLVGEPGIGKTRTAAELAEQARRAGACVLWGACYEGEWAPPFGPFAEALASHARQCEPDTLRSDLGLGAAPIARVIAAVRERLPDTPEPATLQPDEERFRLFDAVSQFLIAIAARTPLVLVLDDLHWADKGTIAMLRHVARFAPQHRLLLLSTYRDAELEPQHPLTDALGAFYRETTCERIALKGLEEPEIEQLIAKSAVTSGQHAALAASISAATNGNPFFVREILQHLAEEARSGGAFDPTAIGIPDSVRQVTTRRLRRLSREVGRLLSVAAASSGQFQLDVVAQVAGLNEAAALNAIDDALHAQLARATESVDRYEFSHALIRETVYRQLSPSRQARLHRQLAEAIERIYARRIEEHAAEIAYHYSRSATLSGAERGAEHALVAAERAAAQYAHDEVASQLRIALELVPVDDARRPRLMSRLALVLCWTFDFDAAFEQAQTAAKEIAERESTDAAADYLAQVVSAMDGNGFHDGAFQLAQQGLRYAGERRDATWVILKTRDILSRETADPDFPGFPVDSPARREVKLHIGKVPVDVSLHATFFMFASRDDILARGDVWSGLLGLDRDAPARLRSRAQDFERRGMIGRATLAWSWVFRACTACGRFTEAREARSHLASLTARGVNAPTFLATVTGAEDEWRMARDEDWDDPMGISGPGKLGNVEAWYRVTNHAAIARVHARMGRVDRAMRRLESVVPAVERAPGWAENYVRIACDAAETLWFCHRTDHAETIERNLLQKVVIPDFRLPMMDGRLALARLCALQGRCDEAAEWFAKARRALDEQGAGPLRAIVDYDEAFMFVRRGEPGDVDRAAPLRDAALAQFHAIGMPGWIKRAEVLVEGRQSLTEQTEPLSTSLVNQATVNVETSEISLPHLSRSALRSAAGDPSDAVAVFRLDGDFWTITYEERTIRLRDTRGLRYLALLLQHPGRRLHASDLVRELLSDGDRSRAAFDPDTQVEASLGHAGPLLDRRAREEFRARLVELREQLGDAEEMNDLGRIERLRAEIDALGGELAAAARDRKSVSHAERARLTATKGLKSAIERIAARHPDLGRHLAATVRRGNFCIYEPDPRRPIDWAG